MSKKKGKEVISQKKTRPVQNKIGDAHITESNNKSWIWMILLTGITLFCFYNTLKNGFVNWDDDKNFLEHPAIQNLTRADFWEATKYIFTNNVIGNYNPLANWTFAIEKVWFGFEQPKYWHLNNVILHSICVLLVFKIGHKLGLNLLSSFLLALLFSIHPMRVESVAWITERKDVLFGVFYLGAMYQYISWVKDNKNIRWVFIYLFFILSLFSKIQAVSLPLSLLAVDYFLRDKLNWGHVFSKIPLFLLSTFFGILGVYFLKEYGSIENATSGTDYNFIQRLFIGAFSFTIYLVKFVFPFRMSPLYPYPHEIPWYFYVSIIILPVVLFGLWWAYKNKHKAVFFGLIFFIVNIVFLLQILAAGQGFIADRFTYIAYLGLFFIPVYYIESAIKKNANKTNVMYGVMAFILLVFSYMTIQQNKIWENSATMWTHVLKYYKNTTTPYGNRANYYRDNGMYKEAMADYNKSIALKDQQPQAYNSRARLFFTVAKGKDTLLLALRDYNKAIEYSPNDGEFYTNRGATYARLGDLNRAIADLTKGIELKPDHSVAYLNRSIMYQQINRQDLAVKDIDKYLQMKPKDADMWYEKGRVHRILSQNPQALDAYNKAISLNGSKGLFYYERSKTFYLLGDPARAKGDFQKAVQLQFQIPPGDTYPTTLGL
ncbi:MAG: tetratricopeptide repeat protein [Saprospiraceae bacterium]|nr:tetratricopeptide repeat protein [Saprospiraceae bacterium]MBK8082149.1 tetratricopeptide repeat protein [Saprospiraceae bacterium]MBK8817849.1 tetratricopeptide repeat protein [Saprospiraceae bacterium]MBK8854794.1 tetratricopeptide repeat protein [Saprospiraceae bacterium]MBK9044245.1 tetratricopeptide repeat protein [Saprospiraceae bacterium]